MSAPVWLLAILRPHAAYYWFVVRTYSPACSACLGRLATLTFLLIFGIGEINVTGRLLDSRAMSAYLADASERSVHFWF